MSIQLLARGALAACSLALAVLAPSADAAKNCSGREPGMNYISKDPAECSTLLFTCTEGYTPFFNDCGCGCQVVDGTTCNYDDPSRTYISRDPAQCATIRFMCEVGKQPFFDDCGCGCVLAP